MTLHHAMDGKDYGENINSQVDLGQHHADRHVHHRHCTLGPGWHAGD